MPDTLQSLERELDSIMMTLWEKKDNLERLDRAIRECESAAAAPDAEIPPAAWLELAEGLTRQREDMKASIADYETERAKIRALIQSLQTP